MNRKLPTVVALGELLWDVFPDGARFGGAPGNFAHHAAALGADTYLVSAVGDDDLGRQAVERLKGSRIDISHLATCDSRPTGSVSITVDDLGHPSYQFHDNESWDALGWTDGLAALADRCDAACFGTLGQRSEQSRVTIQRFVASTRPTALRILDINLRRPYVSDSVIDQSLGLANVLKLNDDELKFLADLYGLTAKSESDQARQMVDRFDLQLVALTRGPRGALVTDGESVFVVAAKPTEIVDTVGAGDAFTASLTIGLLGGVDLARATEAACRIAEYVCTQAGATPALPESLCTPLLRTD